MGQQMKNNIFYNSESFKEKLEELSFDSNTVKEISSLTGYMSFNGLLEIIKYFGSKKKFNIFYSNLIPSPKNYLNIDSYLKDFLKDMYQWIINYKEIKELSNKGNIKIHKIDEKDGINYHGKVYNFKKDNDESLTMIGSSNLSKNGIDFFKSNKINNEVNIIVDDNKSNNFEAIKNKIKDSFSISGDDFNSIIDRYVQIKKDDGWKGLFKSIVSYSNTIGNEISINKFIDDRWSKILNDYQIITLKSILKSMNNYGGSILNYDVGLGKTLIGVAVADYYGLYKNEAPYVIAPKRMVTDWKSQLDLEVNIDGKKIKIQDYLKNKGSKIGFSKERVKSYNDFMNERKKPKVIIIDEAHNFRNLKTEKRNELIKEIYDLDDDELKNFTNKKGFIDWSKIVSNEIRILLITATPCHNRISDVKNLLDILPTYNTDNDDKTDITDIYERRIKILKDNINIDNLKEDQTKLIRYFFNRVNKEKWRYNEESNNSNFYFPRRKNIGDQNKFILDKNDSIVKKILCNENIEITKINEIINERNEIKETINQLAKEGFLAEKAPELNKFNFYFSIDSSFYAFICSLFRKINRMIKSGMKLRIDLEKYNEKLEFLTGLRVEDDYNLKSDDESNENILEDIINNSKISDSDEEVYSNAMLCDESDEYELKEKNIREFSDNFIERINLNIDAATKLYDDLLEKSINGFKSYKNICSDGKSDYKLIYLKTLINELELKDRKIIIFVNRKSTMNMMFENLKNDYNILSINGDNTLKYSLDGLDGEIKDSNGSITKYLFSPKSNPKKTSNDKNWNYLDENKEKFNILLTTNTFSEGHNLQEATVVINYDLDWNPSIMLQRIGRVDRYRDYKNTYVDEKFKDVYIYNIYLSDNKENSFINLHERLFEKLKVHDIFRSVSLCEVYNDVDKSWKHISRNEEEINKDLECKSKDNEDYDDIMQLVIEGENLSTEDLYINKIKKWTNKTEKDSNCCEKHILIDRTTTEHKIFIVFEARDNRGNKKLIYYWNGCESIKTDHIEFLLKNRYYMHNENNLINLSVNELCKSEYTDYINEYGKFIESIDLNDELNNRLYVRRKGFTIDKIVSIYMLIGGKNKCLKE